MSGNLPNDEVNIPCVECGRPRSEHHAFQGPDIPEGCKCWGDGSWTMSRIPAVCEKYSLDPGGDPICAVCEHNEECHAK